MQEIETYENINEALESLDNGGRLKRREVE